MVVGLFDSLFDGAGGGGGEECVWNMFFVAVVSAVSVGRIHVINTSGKREDNDNGKDRFVSHSTTRLRE